MKDVFTNIKSKKCHKKCQISYTAKHWRHQGVQGVRMLPLEFENDDVICPSPANYLNFFAGAFGARNNCTKKIAKMETFCLQRAKNRQSFPTRIVLNACKFVLTTKNLQRLAVFYLLCKIESYFLAKNRPSSTPWKNFW